MAGINEYYNAVPGIASTLESVESNAFWGPRSHLLLMPRLIDSATTDAGHSARTTLLRGGLLLGEVTATKRLKAWSPTATDGTQRLFGVLPHTLDMLADGTAVHRQMHVVVRGNLKASGLIVPGEASAGLDGTEFELRARQQLSGRFVLDDEPAFGNVMGGGGWVPRRLVAGDLTAGAITLTEADSGTWFILGTAAATTFHLPAITADERYGFRVRITNAQDQNLIIDTVAGGQLIVFNDIAANSVALQTAGDLIGGTFEIFGYHDGTNGKYIVIPSLWADGVLVQTLTIAT